jgi:hypothetical protein
MTGAISMGFLHKVLNGCASGLQMPSRPLPEDDHNSIESLDATTALAQLPVH